MSRRSTVAIAAATGLVALGACALAAVGDTAGGSADAGGWAGWTGQVNSAATSDLAAMTPDDAVAVALLARSARAASSLPYSGRAESVERGATSETDLVHVPGRGTVVTVVSPVAAAARLAPEGRSGSLADDGRVLTLLSIHYRVLREAALDASVAGRPTDAVVAVGATGAVAARFWLDRATGLLMRKELVDAAGSVWRSSEFRSLRTGVPPDTALPATTSDPWGTPLTDAALRSERQEGCACPEALPGGLTLLETSRAPSGAVLASPVVHQVFSDGLATVSLFSLAGALSPADRDGLRQRGFTSVTIDGGSAWVRPSSATSPATTVVWGSHGWVLTLVSTDDADPMATATAVLDALPPSLDDVDGSLWARILRGWHRITGGRA